MSMSDELVERALTHAQAGTGQEEAVQDLLDCCDGHRVAAVHARQVLLERLEADPSDQVADRAMGLVQEMLNRDVWDVVA
jgi:hypothetical protein